MPSAYINKLGIDRYLQSLKVSGGSGLGIKSLWNDWCKVSSVMGIEIHECRFSLIGLAECGVDVLPLRYTTTPKKWAVMEI